MATYVADESFTKVPPAQLLAAGYSGVIGYCSYSADKNLSGPYVQSCLAAGLKVGLVWEGGPQEPWHLGAGGGAQHARDFVAQAQALGFHSGVLWMVAEDPATAPRSAWSNMDAYFAAARPIIEAAGFELGGYGSEVYLDHALAAGVLTHKWLVGGWSADLAGDLIQQSNNPGRSTLGGAVDSDYAPSDTWGWVSTDSSGTAHLTGGNELTQDEHDALMAVAKVIGSTDAAKDDAGNGIPDHWVVAYTLGKARAIEQAVAALDTKVTKMGTAGVDLDALASRVADVLAARLGKAA